MIENLINNEKKPLILLEAYSKNEDPKKRLTSKSSKKEKHGDSIKKKVKKN